MLIENESLVICPIQINWRDFCIDICEGNRVAKIAAQIELRDEVFYEQVVGS